MTHDIMEHVRVTKELLDEEVSFASITLLDIRGSAPQIIGAKAIVTDQGIVAGTIGGGKIEGASIDYAHRILSGDEGITNDLVTWNLQSDIGMTCGGEVKLFFEFHRQTVWPIAVFGAGHIAQALIPMLTKLNCKVTCIDPRSDWIAKLDDHPKLRKRCVANPADLVGEFSERTFFVLMSKGHSADLPVLTEILSTRKAPYIGVIGSKQKASVLRRELSEKQIDSKKIDSVFCPIGFPIGNNTPAEVAISVLAQLLKVRDEVGIFDHKTKEF